MISDCLPEVSELSQQDTFSRLLSQEGDYLTPNISHDDKKKIELVITVLFIYFLIKITNVDLHAKEKTLLS